MDVSMERSHGRAIGFAVIVIAILVVGAIWRRDNPVENQVGAQEGGQIDSAAQPATQVTPPATQPGGDETPTEGQQAAASG
jgi:hypothetical protein